jgi:putative transposase
VLHAAVERHGSPETIVTDGGGIFKSNRAKAVYSLNIQRRMADFHFERAEKWEGLLAEHERWLESYNTQRYWAHEGREDGRRSPSEVLQGALFPYLEAL